MKLTVYYKAIDPYYSSHEQVFIGIIEESCYDQKYEFEECLGRNHSNGISNIYEVTSEELIK